MAAVEPIAGHDVTRVRADNPGPLTLDGSNSWVIGRDPCWVVDPGPRLEEHVRQVFDEVERRGGLGGIALTHRHRDHDEAVPALRERAGPAPVAAASGGEVTLADGQSFGPLTAVPVPGHTPDHLAFVVGRACFTGDAVLGEGSVFIAPLPGAMSGYLEGLRRLRAMDLALLCPGHGPPVRSANAKLDEYLAHRLERERRLAAALDRGLRDEEDLLDQAWSEVPAELRGVAALNLRAHLHKLAEDGRLPPGVEVPEADDAGPVV
jgi:glyoxylase-like metal-dependent hydrolase (beta-lactamase superfamily II)